MTKIAIIIPSRMKSTRLPGKPLATFGGKTLVEHVWLKATDAEIGDVYVATDHEDIVTEIERFGGKAVMTPPECPCGTDRCFAAAERLDEDYDVIINLQGDMPFITPTQIAEVLEPLERGFDIGTLIYPMPESEQQNPNSVKAVVSMDPESGVGQCHWFCRAGLAYGYFHAGVYAYTRESLSKYASMPESEYEKVEKLEQLRALQAGMTIGAKLTDPIAGEINTLEDLQAAKDRCGT